MAQEAEQTAYRCAAIANPEDCGWPFCGCDPAADKVLAAIQEHDMEIVPVRRGAPPNSGPCQTCGGSRHIHIVEGACTPAHDEDCPTCVGRLFNGVRLFSVIPLAKQEA